jgi:hypothetical protein
MRGKSRKPKSEDNKALRSAKRDVINEFMISIGEIFSGILDLFR